MNVDPQAALDALRAFFEEARNYDGKVVPEDVVDAAEFFDGLDQWMSRGGFLPKDWERPCGTLTRR